MADGGAKFSLREGRTDEANGKVRRTTSDEPYDYEAYPLGRVEPGLSEKKVNVVEADADHGFANYKEAKDWAKLNITKTYNNEETGGKGDVRISNAAIDKFLSQSAVDKSDNKDVHMAVLKVLPEVLRTSIDVETHPDFLKGEDGKRRVENGINKDVLVHRCYGAVSIDGKPYRVKITLKENVKTKETTHTHSYEATEIELSAGQHGDVTMTSPRNSNNSISAAKLLADVEKSYDKGKKLLDESKDLTDGGAKFSLREDEPSDKLFVSLQNKKGKDYYDTIDILCERIRDGRASLRGEIEPDQEERSRRYRQALESSPETEEEFQAWLKAASAVKPNR